MRKLKRIIKKQNNLRYNKKNVNKKFYYRNRRNSNYINIELMADYCAYGLWENGISIEIEDLPQSIYYLKKRIEKWSNFFESLNLFSKTKFQSKIIENSIHFKKWIEEGLDIAINIRKKLGYQYKISYFIENNSNRILIDKNLNFKINKSNLHKEYYFLHFKNC